jgi:hypothetical protein
MLLLYLASQMKLHRPASEDSIITPKTSLYKMKAQEEIISKEDILEF